MPLFYIIWWCDGGFIMSWKILVAILICVLVILAAWYTLPKTFDGTYISFQYPHDWDIVNHSNSGPLGESEVVVIGSNAMPLDCVIIDVYTNRTLQEIENIRSLLSVQLPSENIDGVECDVYSGGGFRSYVFQKNGMFLW